MNVPLHAPRSRFAGRTGKLARMVALVMFATSAIATACAANTARHHANVIRILIKTDAGNITAELDSVRAPVTVANFLRYVDAGLYRNGSFYRTVRADNQPNDSVKITVIQGGRREDRAVPSFAPIAIERTSVTGIRHRDGTLSMARSGPNSATDAFFICVGDQPALDFGGHRNLDGQGFAAFGRVTAGMDVVRRINAAPVRAQQLQPPVHILDISRM